jgi:hypothetical protein
MGGVLMAENIQNVYIFNLCEDSKISARTITRIFKYAKNTLIDEELIIQAIGNTPTSQYIISQFRGLDKAYLSIYSLIIADINIYNIEYLKTHFASIDDVANKSDGLNTLQLQQKTKDKIVNFIETYSELVCLSDNNINHIIEKVLGKLNTSVSTDELFYECIGINPSIDADKFYSSIDSLASEGKIKITASGIQKKMVSIEEYFNNMVSDKSKEVTFDRINGIMPTELSQKYDLTRQRIDQLLKRQLDKIPILENELKYYELLAQYKLSFDILKEIGYSNQLLVNYVILKYQPKQKKNEIDYVIDNHLESTTIGNSILLNNGWCNIENEITKIDFKIIFMKCVKMHKLRVFTLDEILPIYNDFINKYKLTEKLDFKDVPTFARKIENTGDFINCGNLTFYLFDIDNFSDEFLRKTTEYLDSFYGYGSVLYFFNKYLKLCREHGIENENQLFGILKKLYAEEYREKIDFVRNPSIQTKGLERDEFFKDLISEKQPILLDVFFDYLVENYGLNKSTLYWNLKGWFDKYLNINNELVIGDVPFDQNEADIIRNILNGYEVLSMDYYIQSISKVDPLLLEEFTKPFNIYRLGYKYTNSAIYKSKYFNIDDAYLGLFESLPMRINEEEMYRHFTEQSLNNTRYHYAFKECLVLQYEENSYLNVEKRIEKSKIIDFREKIIDGLSNGQILTVSELYDLPIYRKVCDEQLEIKKMINSLGTQLLESIIKSSTRVTTITNEGSMIFCKGDRVSNKSIIKHIVNEYGVIDKTELIYTLASKYGIDVDFSSGYILDLGLYYNTSSDKIYDSKKRSDQEIEEYLIKEDYSYEMD